MQTMATRIVLAALMLAAALPAAAAGFEVNPMIGTGGIGYGVGSTYPGPSLPFGMARPGPDSARLGKHVSFHHCSGYHYTDNQVRGFSSFRLSGIGIADYGNVLVMPTLNRSGDYQRESSYRAGFSHKDETASPGYYSVVLERSRIRAELTASPHCGMHRYSFPPGKKGRVVFNAAHAILPRDICDARIEVTEDGSLLTGKVVNCGGFTGRNGGVEIFFASRLDAPMRDWGYFGDGGGAWVEVEGEGPVTVFVGISFISVEQAIKHLDLETRGLGFDELRERAAAAWKQALSRIEISGGSPEERTIFYTALYHTMLMPTDLTEAGGLYRGFDEAVHEAKGFRYYSDFSLWDTFRTLHPLLVLIEPDRTRDMLQSLVMMARQGGYLPKWPTAYRYTSCMIGASADNFIADAYLKGIRGFDAEDAYQAARLLAVSAVPEGHGYAGRVGIEEYMASGYVPSDLFGSAASRTIEFSYNDWCLANLARALGHDDDVRMFMERSKNWRNLWDGRTGYLRGRKSDGSFAGPFLPWAWTGYYVEGNARQWLWAPFHDVEGMIELMGGRQAFVERLEEFFEKASRRPDTLLWDNFYWHGNEPDIQAAYLFDLAGRPDLTQKWVRWVMEKKYKDAPNGLDGNDDCGTLSAWYIFSALGFYPLAGSDLYLIGSPLFDKAVVHLKGGDLVIRAVGEPGENVYVRSVTLNGRRLEEPWFRHGEIASGGELVFEMSAAPNRELVAAQSKEILAEVDKNPGAAFIDWAWLKNPILSEPDRMLKDQAVVYQDGWFYVFASTRFADDDPEALTRTPCFYRTRDFKSYECMYDHDLDVAWGGAVKTGTGSPDVTLIDDAWHMVWQSGPDSTRRRNLFYSTSSDLMEWAPARQMNPSLGLTARRIDGALARDGGYYYLGYKSRQRFRVTRSRDQALDGHWLRSRAASAGGNWAENYQFIRIDGTWRMIATARDPKKPLSTGYTDSHEPFIYTMDGDGTEFEHWTRWVDKRHLDIPYEDWNRVMHANSAFLCDWRGHDGYFYLFYAGASDNESFQGRGHGKIGVARSRDLAHWTTPDGRR